MPTLELSRPQVHSVMKSAAVRGFNPYDSHQVYSLLAVKRLADKARREKAPYPFHTQNVGA